AKKSLNIFLLPNFSNEDHVAASIEGQGGHLRICSAYMGHDQTRPPPHSLLRRLVEDSERRKIDLLIGCDANAHHSQWGSTDTNESGESIFDFILSSKLLVGNRGSEPTFVVKNRREVLDITLFSNSLADAITRWRVLDKHSFSDHRYIEVVVNFVNVTKQAVRNPRKANWELYKKILERSLGEPPSETIESYEGLNAMAYKAELRRYNKELRKAKRVAWANFCPNIQETSEAARLRKILSTTAPIVGYIKNTDGQWTTSSQESLETHVNAHFPGCSSEETTQVMHSQGHQGLLNYLLSDRNLKWAIESFKPFKSPGPHGIIPAQLSRAGINLRKWIKKIFSTVFTTGMVPKAWLCTKVVFIPKAGKPSHCTPKDYRPISLSSFLLKTMERLLSLHLQLTINPRDI
ncbi:uncharacterized protein LOC123257210, partial [Drosophila ananassae]|uniref:uncharacterized protein LOC123257210 n=1 Tax=Drosophila ananassae TaxID=7217 RepID=UPI001CFFA0F2